MNKIDDWRFEREFQKRKKELMELDPFIYDIPDEVKQKDPTRYNTWESKGKDIDF
jgi:hypothetical protein